jgi:anaerobic selenocysteine-containing dehydrogenase
VQVKDDRIVKVRGDKNNPASKGYVCNKALYTPHYQGNDQRVLSPLRRKGDGTYEEIDWDTATTEIAEKLNKVIGESGGKSIAICGGGGQGCHLDVPYALFFMQGIGTKYIYNALGQEYTQKYWINGQMFGSENLDFHFDEHRCEVLLMIGSNPWMSHGFQQTRKVIGEISKDPNRTFIVVDPRKHETAEKADVFLMIKPATDVYFLLALINVIVNEGLCDEKYISEHTQEWEEIKWIADLVTPEKAAAICDLDAGQIADIARKFAKAKGAATYIDLGIYHQIYMMESVYLERVLLAITGNIGVPGGNVFPESFMALDPGEGGESEKWKTPVAGIEEIRGLFPPNALPEDILDGGDDRIRAVIVEGSNPFNSYADSNKFRKAFDTLDLLVVIDPVMSEAAQAADYVLPAKCGFEKYEAVFFPKGFPDINFHLRHPVCEGPELAKQECDIYLMLLEKMGIDAMGLMPFMMMKMWQQESDKPAVLSLIRAICMVFAMSHRDALIANGIITGEGDDTEELFQAVLAHPEGLYLCDTLDENNIENLKTDDGKIHLSVPYVLDLLKKLEIPDDVDITAHEEFPFILQTGERTNYTANSLIRHHDWRAAKLPTNYVRMSRQDAERLEISDGETVKVVTDTSTVSIPVMVADNIYPGNLSMPHGFGLTRTNKETGETEQIGINVNELISADHREPISGTPYQKYIRCAIKK